MQKTLVVGLGNPGRKYARTRHNIGFMAIDRLQEKNPVLREQRRFEAIFGQTNIAEHDVLLAKPQTFMNASGEAVGALARWFKIPAKKIIVIYDDLDLPLGKVRLRPGGGSGGHHGIDSIISHLGTQDFVRVRVGIDRPRTGRDAVDHVLEHLSDDEEIAIAQAIETVCDAVSHILEYGIADAMNTFNGV